MKKTLVSALTTALVVGAASTTFAAANPFADVPADHWAYDAVSQLLQDGIINGYGADGTFKGDQNMSRYEMAQIVAKAMAKVDAADNNNKALIDRLSAEFSDELSNLGVRVADLEAKTDNVKWNGLIRYDWNTTNYAGSSEHRKTNIVDRQGDNNLKLRFEPSMTINENWTGHARIDYNFNVDRGTASTGDNLKLDHLWAEGKYGKADVKLGRFGSFSDNSHGLVVDTEVTGIEFNYAPTSDWKFKGTAGRFDLDRALGVGTSWGFDPETLRLTDSEGATYWGLEVDYNNGKFDAGLGYRNVLKTHTFQEIGGSDPDNGSFHVFDLGVGYAFDGGLKLTADYAFGQSLDDGVYDFVGANKNAYSIQLSYKGADAAQPGSWGAYVAYRQLAPFASFAATYDHKKGWYGLNSLKGFEIGADYAFAKNIVGTVKYFNGKDTMLDVGNVDDKVTGYWTRVDFMF